MGDAAAGSISNSKRCQDELAEFPQPKRPRVAPNLIFDILDDDDDDDAGADSGGLANDDAGAGSGGLADDIKSLEGKVTATPESDGPPRPPPQVDLGYLLQASDDELGLPPAVGTSSLSPAMDGGDGVEIVDEEWGFGQVLWGFEEEGLGPYEGLEFGILENEGGIFGNGDYIYDDGGLLFDFCSGFVSGPLD